MKRWIRRLAVALVVLAPAYWWFFVESAAPQGAFVIDLPALRDLARVHGDDPKPNAIRVEQVSEFEFPETAVLAGSGWSTAKMPVFSYQLVYPDRTVILDTAMDAKTASSAARFDEAAYQRMVAAMDKASLVLITHEHFDHFGGLATHPRRDQLPVELTDEQLADPKKREPLVLPPGAFPNRVPFSYPRAAALAPGIALLRAPGHTPGSQLVFVQLENGEEYLFLGDVAWHTANYEQVRERARLVTQFFLGEDRDAVLQQLAAIKALVAKEPNLHVVPGHDGVAMQRLLDARLISATFQP